MCGIAGAVWNDASKAVERATLQRMIDVLRHRGPDGEGMYVAEGRLQPGCRACARRRPGPSPAGHHRRRRRPAAAVERRRLGLGRLQRRNLQLPRSAPPARRRRPPVPHPKRHRSARPSLRGRRARSSLTHLNGMFALALWDAKRQQLILARDRLGKKPLVYRHEPGRLLFASELKSLLEVPGVPREIDPQALDEYLTYQYVPHPRTIFRGIAKLPPGHYAVYRDGRLDVRPYWQPDFNVEDDRPGRRVRPTSCASC